MNRAQRRKAGIEQHDLKSWVAKYPEAPVKRKEFVTILNAAMDVAFRNYHERNRPYRVLARGLAHLIKYPLLFARRLWRRVAR